MPSAGGVTADGTGTADAAATNESTVSSGEQPWTKKVDGLFGHLVGYVASVLFFDFGTSRWLGTSIPFVVVWLLFGATFLTIRMGFINLRGFRHAIDLTRGVYDTPGEPGEVSHFQALSAALSATVGLGNIAGVAIAIGTGGPGATFWIIMVGLLGMTAKFAECTLGQLYRVSDEDGHVLGGPMRYLQDRLEGHRTGTSGQGPRGDLHAAVHRCKFRRRQCIPSRPVARGNPRRRRDPARPPVHLRHHHGGARSAS